jgi:hypothetical protein
VQSNKHIGLFAMPILSNIRSWYNMANIKEVAKDNWRYRVRYKKNGVYWEVA